MDDITVVVEPDEPIQVEVEGLEPAEITVDVIDGGLVGSPGPPGPSNIGLITDHINADNPHPNYDDGASLVFLYANAKV